MRDFVLMTDSCCDLPASLAESLEITVLPLSYVIEGHEYFDTLDHHDMTPEDFFDRLRNGITASTSAISVGTFHDRMEEIVSAGQDILCVCFSSALSTTYQSARIAAEDVLSAHPEGNIVVLDSLCASLGQGLLLYLAARKKAEGATLDELAQFVEQEKLHICHWFVVDDLLHLKRGGRISAVSAVLGTALQMKPILHVDNEGRLIPVTKVRGRKAAMAELLHRCQPTDASTVFIVHGDCLADAEALAQSVREQYAVETLVIRQLGAVIGSHAGPGTLSVFFVGEER